MSDIGLAAVVLCASAWGTPPAAPGQRALDPVGYLTIAAAAAALLWWRREPLRCTAAVGLAVGGYLTLGYPLGPVLLAVVLAVFGLTCFEPPRRGLFAVAALLALGAAVLTFRTVTGGEPGTDPLWSVIARLAGLLVLVAVSGLLVRFRRDADLRMRAALARQAAAEERLRVAQDVHDIVGHGLAVIALQSGAALHGMDRDSADPATARRALAAIRTASTQALDDLRGELELLRRAPDGPPGSAAALDALIERVRAAGVEVTVRADIDLDGLPTELNRVVFRVVQEALTNVLRHAGTGVAVGVALLRTGSGLRVEVTDSDEHGQAAAAVAHPAGTTHDFEGSGIRGMRSRVAAVGGSLSADRLPSGGFTVRAEFPLTPVAS